MERTEAACRSRESEAPTAEQREGILVQGLAQLASHLANELQGLDNDGRLRRAVADLPDARSRLQAVAEISEQAAHRTLDLVEEAQAEVRSLKNHDDPQVRAGAQRLATVCVSLAEAQGFQDLSGQIISRVHGILETMQGGLEALMERAGVPLPKAQDATPPPELAGPQVAGLQTKETASQDDADSLLDDLGI